MCDVQCPLSRQRELATILIRCYENVSHPIALNMGWPEGLPITDTLATGTLERLLRAASLYDFERRL